MTKSIAISQENDRVTVSAGILSFVMNIESAQFDLRWEVAPHPGTWGTLNGCHSGAWIRDAGGAVSFRRFIPLEPLTWKKIPLDEEMNTVGLQGEGLLFTGTSNLFEQWTIRVFFLAGDTRLLVDLHVTGLAGKAPVYSLVPLAWEASRATGKTNLLGNGVTGWKILGNGFQSWSVNEIFSGTDKNKASLIGLAKKVNHMDANEVNPERGAKGNFTSDWVSCTYNPESHLGLVAGFVTGWRAFGRVITELDPGRDRLGAIAAHSFLDPWEPSAETFTSELFSLALSPIDQNPFHALQEYARLTGELMGARSGEKVPVGWCSWYYYYTKVTEDDVIQNLGFFRDHKEELPIDFFQLDDGYQSEIGDWTSVNEKFPHGLRWLTDQIHADGFKAGIWIAPFFASSKSQVLVEHPDWILRDTKGKKIKALYNWGHWQYALDPTLPAVQEHLREVFQVITREWNFDFVKIDFVYGVAVKDTKYHDPTVTRASAYRGGIELIRESLGPDRFLLGCGAPLLPCVGLVDAMRIGPDTKAQWYGLKRVGKLAKIYAPSLYPALQSTLLRSYFHAHLWINDPDCLIVRETGDQSDLTEAEIQTELAVFGLSNGQILVSDNMANLGPDRVELLRTILPPLPLGEMGIPLDWMEGPVPSLLQLDVTRPFGAWKVLGIINWDKDPVARLLELEPRWGYDPNTWYALYEFWSRKFVGIIKGGTQFSTAQIAPHGCEVYRVTPLGNAETPSLVGSTLHFSQGAVEVKNFTFDKPGKKITLELVPTENRAGKLLLFLPKIHQYSDSEPRCEVTRQNIDRGTLIWVNLPLKGDTLTIHLS